MIAKLLCFFKGHKRGKRKHPIHLAGPEGKITGHLFFCPRCGAEWTRKVKA